MELSIDYSILNHALFYYQQQGFTLLNVPWVVDTDISDLTKPPEKKNFIVDDKCLVGSGEQSFLQLIKDQTKFDGGTTASDARTLTYGRYVAITPCFRDDEIDEIHRRYFMKVELFVYDSVETLNVLYPEVVELCEEFFNQYTKTKREFELEMGNNRPVDILDLKTGIELGSYGIRNLTIKGKSSPSWIYATGCAEPRLSQVIRLNKEPGYHIRNTPKTKVGTFLKILEEIEEAKDAHLSNNKVMELVELSDVLGAIELYVKFKYGMSLEDLQIMNKTTQRAFRNGRR